MPPILELHGITKRFPGVLANDSVDFTLEQGTVHALLGENGAGKTTLMNILYGLYKPDEGEIRVNGELVDIDNPQDAIALGIGMVHQHFMLVPVMTVAENVMLGVESKRFGAFLDRTKVVREIEDISQRHGLAVDPKAHINELTVGVQQRVEIIKVLYREADILVLDEPTAVLTPQEAEDLFEVLESLVAQGKSIIFITHKLKEVLAIADQITVLRGGRVVGSVKPDETNEGELASMMVGRNVILTVDKQPAQPGDVILQVTDLQALDDRGNMAVSNVSFEVHAGEILGVAGVQGNGQTELVKAITGLRPMESGRVTIMDQDTSNAAPRTVLEAGVAHVPEDRQQDGLVLSYPVIDNLALNTYYLPPFANGVTINERQLEENARLRVDEFDIRTPSIFTLTSSLSGGNQQKVIVAREFSRNNKLLIAAQPTRGLDVGSIEYIHSLLVRRRDDGAAVLLVSSELDEITALSDRIAVMFEGKIAAIVPAGSVTREQLGLLMAGTPPEEVLQAMPEAAPTAASD